MRYFDQRTEEQIRFSNPDRLFLLIVRYLSYRLKYHQRVRQLPPQIAKIIFIITKTWVRLVVRTFHMICPSRYTNADPYEILWVDPNQIECISGIHDKRRRGWVINGDWDRNCNSFLNKPIPKSIHQHYLQGVPWEETPLAEQYENKKQFDTKCRKIEQLYNSISKNGFQQQADLVEESPSEVWSRANVTIAPYTNEITIDIGRDGELMWNMLGRHRLAIAKVLNIDLIPVLVFARHTRWEQKRQEAVSNENEFVMSHPDIYNKYKENADPKSSQAISPSNIRYRSKPVAEQICALFDYNAAKECDGFDRLLLFFQRYISTSINFHQNLSGLPRPIVSVFSQVVILIERLKITVFRKFTYRKYTDADPFKTFKISPTKIKYTTGSPLSKRRGWVVSGNWHKKGMPFFDQQTPKGIHEHYVRGYSWDNTSFSSRYSKDKKKFKKKVSRIESTYMLIKKEGYKSQSEILKSNPEIAWSNLNDTFHPKLNEIAVDIGPNGEFLWNICGRHRLAIAKVLDSEKVTVQVFRRHAQWQKIRDDIRSGKEVPEQLQNHPDLADLN